MILSLIGMSNVGKSHWAKRLETERGFVRFCCDDLIAQRLHDLLPENDKQDVDALATWMGMPHEPGYGEREAAYLAAEAAVLEKVIETIPLLFTCPPKPWRRWKEGLGVVNAIIDTTGSVIYLPEPLLRQLKDISTVVYLSTTQSQIAGMTERFFSSPKPLVWGERFHVQPGESHEAALRRCYPSLVAWRQDCYSAFAHQSIPFFQHHDPIYTTEAFLYDVLQHQRPRAA